jgi:hypothetical protein
VAAITADEMGLEVFDFVSKQWTELVRLPLGYPNWSPDGSSIYFDTLGSPPGIDRVRLADRKVEHLVNLRGKPQLWSFDDWFGLTADDSPLRSRDVSFEEIYALDWTTPSVRVRVGLVGKSHSRFL